MKSSIGVSFCRILSLTMLTCMALSSAAMATSVTVTPSSSSNSVCDPNVKSMLQSAGAATATADINTISSVIQPPTSLKNVSKLECQQQAWQTCDQKPAEQRAGCVQQEMTKNCPEDANATNWQNTTNNTQKAIACGQQYTSGSTEYQNCMNATSAPTTTASTATFDRINIYAGATEPVSKVASGNCHPGIPTGVKINGVNEIVCPNPGCYPKKDGNAFKCVKY